MKKRYIILAVVALALGGFAYHRWVYLPAHPKVVDFAYVLSDAEPLLDSRAEIHNTIATLKNGERVEVLSRDLGWAQVRTASGESGWVEDKALMDAQVYDSGKRLLVELNSAPVQAQGHASSSVNLRLEPSRDGAVLDRLSRNQKVEILGRRLIARSAGPDDSNEEPPADKSSVAPPDVWYLVRAESRAGWVYGRLISLDVPDEIAHYAQDYNMVAWLVLNTVDDNGRQVPQYVTADREDTLEYDFTRIRVFTWWAAQGHYSTAFVQSGLKGFFPIQVDHRGGNTDFRLRLVEGKGNKFQKVYRLYDTVVRPLGTVEGWDSNAMPVANERKPARRGARSR
ncbi:MAG: SH3 domain-containing protein [Deltaproteobacteria bacterium]